MLFLAWGYLHVRGDPYAYGDPYQPYLDSTVAALAVSVPALFFVALTGLAGLLAQGVVGRVGLLVVLVAAVGFVLAFTGAAVGVVRGIEGGLGWYDAYRWRQWPPSGRFGRTQHARESLLSVSPRQGTPGR
jgi:hypothetical protein